MQVVLGERAKMEDVQKVFRAKLGPRESKFELQLPSSFHQGGEKEYYFESLSLTPDFYQQQAKLFQLETLEEAKEIIRYDISMSLKFNEGYYRGPEFGIRESVPTGELIKRINDHFERNRPDGTLYPPFVVDWIITSFHRPDMTGNQTMMAYEQMAINFYDDEYDPEKHQNWLPKSLKKNHMFNPYLYPTHNEEDFYERLRCRISLGPNVSISFSSENIWRALGFTEHQIGSRGFNNQFRINNKGTHYDQMVAMDPPRKLAPRYEPNKIYVGVYSPFIHLNPGQWYINIPRKDLNDPTKFHNILSPFLKGISRAINFRLDFEYKDDTNNCSFLFPENPSVDFEMRLPLELSRILGFGQTEIITKKNLVGKSLTEVYSDSQFEIKSKTLVYDTDMIVVTLDFTSSLSTMNMVDKVVAVLYPTVGGISKMEFGTGSRFPISPFSSFIKLTFSRLSDEGSYVPLSWPVSAFLGGVLKGTIKRVRQFD